MVDNTLFIIVTVISICLGLLSLIAGLVCLVQYARTRKIVWLVVGLLLTFIFPGLAACCAITTWVIPTSAPVPFMAYGPPPKMTP